MMRLIIFGALLCSTAALASPRELEIGRGERLLVVAPHPDDETLGAAGLMQRVLARGGHVQVVLVTAGDGYREAVAATSGGVEPSHFIAYGERRIGEAGAALQVLGNGRIRTSVLGFPDGSLTALLSNHWRSATPARSPFTGSDRPPYAQAADHTLTYAGIPLRDALVKVLTNTRPSLIALPDWVDAHPDHSATGKFVMLAVDAWLANSGSHLESPPRMLAYLIHWHGWPAPPGTWKGPEFPQPRATSELQLPNDLPQRSLTRRTLTLSNAEISQKSRALSQHASQKAVDPYLLGKFIRRTEPFSMFTARELPQLRAALQERD